MKKMFQKSKSKYHNIKVEINHITFSSKKEANRYQELKALERLGAIKELQLQPKFELQPKFKVEDKTIRPIYYIGDFSYWLPTKDGRYKVIVEDTKGFRTKEYRLKAKMFAHKFGFEISEV